MVGLRMHSDSSSQRFSNTAGSDVRSAATLRRAVMPLHNQKCTDLIDCGRSPRHKTRPDTIRYLQVELVLCPLRDVLEIGM